MYCTYILYNIVGSNGIALLFRGVISHISLRYGGFPRPALFSCSSLEFVSVVLEGKVFVP